MASTADHLDARARRELEGERLRHAARVAEIQAGGRRAAKELDRHLDRVQEIMADFTRRRLHAAPGHHGRPQGALPWLNPDSL
jgi:hypothetical protein